MTEVQQGKVLASCNSTGMSRFNYAHIEVRPDNGSGPPNNYSIPFVYKDADDKGRTAVANLLQIAEREETVEIDGIALTSRRRTVAQRGIRARGPQAYVRGVVRRRLQRRLGL